MAPLARPNRKRVKPAGPGTRFIDAAQAVFQENAGIIRSGGFQCKNGEASIRQRHGLAVSGQHFIYGGDAGISVTQILCQPVGIQAFHHHTVLNMAAALTAFAALIVNNVFCVDQHRHCFLFIHGNPPKKAVTGDPSRPKTYRTNSVVPVSSYNRFTHMRPSSSSGAGCRPPAEKGTWRGSRWN